VVKCSMVTNIVEQVWCYLLDAKRVKCYFCYRTTTVGIYGVRNHNLLQNIINELVTTNKYFMLIGDFNYRFSSWPPLENDSSISRESCFCRQDALPVTKKLHHRTNKIISNTLQRKLITKKTKIQVKIRHVRQHLNAQTSVNPHM